MSDAATPNTDWETWNWRDAVSPEERRELLAGRQPARRALARAELGARVRRDGAGGVGAEPAHDRARTVRDRRAPARTRPRSPRAGTGRARSAGSRARPRGTSRPSPLPGGDAAGGTRCARSPSARRAARGRSRRRPRAGARELRLRVELDQTEDARLAVEAELVQRVARRGDAAAQVVGTDEEPRVELREAEEGQRARVAAACGAIAFGEPVHEHADPRAVPARRPPAR